jgi:branched-chain amino acid transport system permease protein
LLFVLRGGSTTFFGSIIGVVLMVLALLLLSGLTLALAWLPYVGLVFLLMMTTAPKAIARLLMANLRLAAFGKLRRLLPAHGVLAAAAAVFLTGAAAAIEMLYHRQLDAALGSKVLFLGVALEVRNAFNWAAALALLAVGAGVLDWRR